MGISIELPVFPYYENKNNQLIFKIFEQVINS